MVTTNEKRAARKSIIEALKAIHIDTERDEKLKEMIIELFDSDERGASIPVPTRYSCNLETRGIAFIEPAGGGKTTAIYRALQSHAFLAANPATSMPRFIHITVESPATLKSLLVGMLEELGVPNVSSSTPNWQLSKLVRKRLEMTGTVLIWIDEAHDLFISRTEGEVEDMLKFIKRLMEGDGAVAMILSGTEKLMEITALDRQVDRRFMFKIVPEDLSELTDCDQLASVLRMYCKEAGIKLDLRDELVERLIYGSRGRFGLVAETTIQAIDLALSLEDDQLSRDHFAEVWGIREGVKWDLNVFAVADWRVVPLNGSKRLAEEPTGRRRKTRRAA